MTTDTTDNTRRDNGTVITSVQALTLSADDVAALRACESVSFHLRKGNAWIQPMLDTVLDTRTYSAREQQLFPDTRNTGAGDRARIITATSSILGYSEEGTGVGWTKHTHPGAACVAMISAARHHEVWPTLAGLIRPGDRLHLGWTASNDTDLLRQAGLHHDYLHLVVLRGERKLTFALTDQIAPAGFPLRMIRRHA